VTSSAGSIAFSLQMPGQPLVFMTTALISMKDGGFNEKKNILAGT